MKHPEYNEEKRLDSLVRDLSAESLYGIENIKLYAYYTYGSVIVYGEILGASIKNDFMMQTKVYDINGDIVAVSKNHESTPDQGNSFPGCIIRKSIYFNGYPFECYVHVSSNIEIASCIL